MRNFQKLKTIEDYKVLDAPEFVCKDYGISVPFEEQMILRMLVRPKYGDWYIPKSLQYLCDTIGDMADYDFKRTGIKDSWCYVTVRHGKITSKTDDEWHFDGASFRTDIIPERNYVWVNNHPTEYKVGTLAIPADFDPIQHNLFTFAAHQLRDSEVRRTAHCTWYLLSPFCLHRRPKINNEDVFRTFIRICFTDIEGRDINNTTNPLLPTPFYGRNPVETFRNKLKDYYAQTEKPIP